MFCFSGFLSFFSFFFVAFVSVLASGIWAMGSEKVRDDFFGKIFLFHFMKIHDLCDLKINKYILRLINVVLWVIVCVL